MAQTYLNDMAQYSGQLRSLSKRSPAQFAAGESEVINAMHRDAYSQALAREKDTGLMTRARLLQVSPELARTSSFLEDAYQNPLPSYLQDTYSEYLRSAQSARGFGGGGTGVTGEEARYLMNVADQRRRELLPFQMQFGQQLLGMQGLGGAMQTSAQDVFGIHAQRKALSIQNKQRRDQRNQGYISAATALVGGLTGGIGALAGAYANYQQGQAAAQNRGFSAQMQPALEYSMMQSLGMPGYGMQPSFDYGAYSGMSSGAIYGGPQARIMPPRY